MRAIDSLLFTEQTAPATPGTGLVALYPKADGKLYIKDDAGLETILGGVTDGDKGDITVSSSGTVWTADADAVVKMTGAQTVAGIKTFSSEVTVPVGAVGTPSVNFAADLTTGMYRVGASSIGFALGGTNTLTLAATSLTSTQPFLAPNGSAANVAFGFSGDPNTGMYTNGADTLRLVTGGSTRLTIDNSNVTAAQSILGPAGTLSNPAFGFSGDPNTGFYSTGVADTMALVTGGTARITVDTTSVTSTLPFRGPIGSVSAVTYGFAADPDTGMCSDAVANQLFLVTGGTARILIGESDLSVTLPIREVVGSSTAPSFSFTSDTNTGMYQTGTADTLGFATGGNAVLTLTAAREARLNDQFDIEVMTWMVD